MARKPINPIARLEKEITKLQQQLIKAHTTKIAKLDKAVISTSGKIKKAQVKLATLVGKKTPAAARQKTAAKELLNSLKITLRGLKSQLSDAKTELKSVEFLLKAEQNALKARPKSRKKVLKKKAVKQTIKVAKIDNKAKLTTLDLDRPVAKAKPKKIWKPEVTTEKPSITATTTRTEIKEKKIGKATQKTVGKEVESTSNEATTVAKADIRKPEVKKPQKAEKTTEVQAEKASKSTKSVVETETDGGETGDIPRITNWHAIPIVKPDTN